MSLFSVIGRLVLQKQVLQFFIIITLVWQSLDRYDNRLCHEATTIQTITKPIPTVVVVVVLLFYIHGKHLRSCRDGQLT